MQKLSSILVVLDRRRSPRHVLAKAMVLARHFRAKVELFLYETEEAYLGDARSFLGSVQRSITAEDVSISTHAASGRPLYEGIVRRALETGADLLIKESAEDELDVNDWQLARTCPVPLMLTRGRPWQPEPRFAAALDFSETPELANAITDTSEYLASGCHAGLEFIYIERAAGARGYDALILGALSPRRGVADLDALDGDLVLVRPGAGHVRVKQPEAPIPGTPIFGPDEARQGYALNRMCYSFNDAANRAAFVADEEAYCARFALTPGQREAVRRRDVLAMLEAGGNIYYLAKLAGIFKLGVQDIGAQQTGMSVEAFKEKLAAAAGH